MAFDIVEATFASVITESILFGLFSILFALSVYILYGKKMVMKPLRMRFFCAVSAMYALAVVHIALNIQRALEGFVRLHYESYDPSQYFNLNQGALDFSRMMIYVLESLLGDGFMIYRLYIVCSGYRRVMVPSFLLLSGSVATGVGMMVAFSKQRSAAPFMSPSLGWMIAFFCFSFVINLGGTLAITIRIWLTMRGTALNVNSPPKLSPLMVVLLDPVMIYSFTLMCIFALFCAQSTALVAVLDWIAQIIGISFSLVIIRIGFKSLWNGKLEYDYNSNTIPSLSTSRHDLRGRFQFQSDLPPKVPPKDDIWRVDTESGTGKPEEEDL